MTFQKTRIIVSATLFAANLALSLSCATAEAQAPHRNAARESRLHHAVLAEPSTGSAEAAFMRNSEPSMTPGNDQGFCGFSGVNKC